MCHLSRVQASTLFSWETAHTVGQAVIKAALDMTVIWPIIQLLHDLVYVAGSEASFQLISKYQNLSPILTKRRAELEDEVNEIAKKIGLAQTNRIRVLACSAFKPEGSFGPCLLPLPIDFILKHEDLPTTLQVSSEKSKEFSSEWNDQVNQWLKSQFRYEYEQPADHSKFDLWQYHHRLKMECHQPERTALIKNAIIGHELGHSALNHNRKTSWIRLGWQLLALPTLGISTLFEERVMLAVSLRHERQADLFCAMKLGPKGLIDYFESSAQQIQALRQHLLPKNPNSAAVLDSIWDAEGNLLSDTTHPKATDRIAYLRGAVAR